MAKDNSKNCNNDEAKGFSGLSSLVSDVDDDINNKKPPDFKKNTDHIKNKPANTNRPKTNIFVSKENKNSKSKTASPTPQNPSSNNWIWIVLVIIVVIVIANSDNKTTSKPRYTDTSGNKYTSSTPKRPVEKKPSVGRNQVLNASNIRYCLAEKIRLDSAESVIDNYSKYDVNRFNSMISDYNSRCGEYRYRSGVLSRAKRDIKPYRSQYWAEGKLRFQKITPKPKAKINSTVLEIQKALNKLGYKAGAADGYMGKKTRSAIKAYQKDSNIKQDGLATKKILSNLKLDLLIKNM